MAGCLVTRDDNRESLSGRGSTKRAPFNQSILRRARHQVSHGFEVLLARLINRGARHL